MFEIPNATNIHDDEDREPVFSVVALMLGLLIVIALVLAIGFGATYFLGGLGLAAFLPVWRDHHTEARQEWVAEQGQGPTAVETWLLRCCWVGIVCVFVGGLVFGGGA